MADNANKEIKTATADDGSTGYEMKIGLGTIAMLIYKESHFGNQDSSEAHG